MKARRGLLCTPIWMLLAMAHSHLGLSSVRRLVRLPA